MTTVSQISRILSKYDRKCVSNICGYNVKTNIHLTLKPCLVTGFDYCHLKLVSFKSLGANYSPDISSCSNSQFPGELSAYFRAEFGTCYLLPSGKMPQQYLAMRYGSKGVNYLAGKMFGA